MTVTSLLADLRPEARNAPPSGIVEVFMHGWGRKGLIPLWAGEGDMPTPSFITDATTRSLAAGETFYTPNRGIPEFREAVARYMSDMYGRELKADRFVCTIGGMHAMQLAMRMILTQDDEILVPSPAWPNFIGCAVTVGATPVDVPMTLTSPGANGRWFLDLDKLKSSITTKTRAIVINSPSNPTGWTATRDELKSVLDMARANGLWILADEIYGKFMLDGQERAPSFHDVMEDDDKILFVQTFSKNWAMTGWRIGWLECHPSLVQTAENLIQYSSSGVATFLQRGGIAALDHGTGFVTHQVERAKLGRDIVCEGLLKTGRVSFAKPEGAFYLYFKVENGGDPMTLAKRLVDDANVGLAPGSAFEKSGESWLRLCFARKAEDLHDATARLVKALG